MQMLSTLSHSQCLIYSWQSNDCINPSQCCLSNAKNFSDFKGNAKFLLNLSDVRDTVRLLSSSQIA